ncbi:MAG: DNA translocase FtsK [Clostridia bacterium]|nr:DNA translocase FtsK [Clostridia bacterium]
MIFVAGVVTLLLAVPFGAGGLWNTLQTFYYALFGLAGAAIPPILLFFGVLRVLNRESKGFLIKSLEVLLLFFLVGGVFYVFSGVPFVQDHVADNVWTFGKGITVHFAGMMNDLIGPIASGGFIGALLGGVFYALGKSQALACVILLLLILTDLMFLFGITLYKVFTRMEEPAKKVGQYTGQKIETVKEDVRARREQVSADRSKKRQTQATQVVNDFYTDNDVKDPGFDKPVKKRAQSDTGLTSDQIFSIFDVLTDKPAPKPAVPVPEVLPAEADKPADEKPQKAPSLTEEEAEAVSAELQDALEAEPVRVYEKPSLDLLDMPNRDNRNYDLDELQANGEKLIEALASFNVSASISEVVPGPTVTRYELVPAKGVKINKFTNLSDDLALHMAAPAGLRIEAPIPNKSAIGIEIPNRSRASISFREIIDNDKFFNAKSKLLTALGKDIAGDVIYADIAKMPHLLVAGTTGSGKSVCMNTMIVSLLYHATPDEVRILLVDPKQVEFGMYNGIPHLLVPVVSDPRKASGALGWAVTEMLSRYKTLNASGVRDIASYNSLCDGDPELQRLPQIVIFIDELADLMSVAPAEVEDSIQRIAQMGRAAGMHLVLATQRPSVDVITGVIKANIPSRIALTVKSQIDSRTMIDQAGAEKLMGYGDMLFYPVGVPKPVRVQGAFLKTAEIERVVEFLKSNGSSQYDDVVQQEIERQAAVDKKKGASSEELAPGGAGKDDDLVNRAIELFVSAPEKASISALQRHLSLGFAKAGRLMDTLEEKGIVGPTEGSKPRKVLITKAQWYEMNAMSAEVTDPGLRDFDDISDPD